MERCIVNIVSEQTIPNFLFIKEKVMFGDRLLFISSRKFEDRIQWIKNALGYADTHYDIILLNDGEEEQWDKMIETIQKKLLRDISYVVNLTGGTKYMMLAVYQAFQGYEAEFHYIPFPKNSILKISDNEPFTLNYRINVEEYLINYGVTFTEKTIIESTQYTDTFFNYFIKGHLNFSIINLLRSYRNTKKIDIQEVEETISHNEKKPQISGLSAFLSGIGFPLKEEGKLCAEETQYITGGWFEEYVYNKIKEKIDPQDVKLGLLIRRSINQQKKSKHVNDLDVVFTYGNKLFVVECKTGIDSQKMFNETVYKAASIKETLLGLSGNSYIFSLAGEDERLKPITETMGITYFDRSFFIDEDKFEMIVQDIKKKAKN